MVFFRLLHETQVLGCLRLLFTATRISSISCQGASGITKRFYDNGYGYAVVLLRVRLTNVKIMILL